MKKFLAFMVVFAMIVILTGCFSNDNNPATTDYEDAVTTTESSDVTENTTLDWELPIDIDTTAEDTTEEATTEEATTEEVTTEDLIDEPEPTTTKPATDNTTEPDTTIPETTVPVTEPVTTVPPTTGSSSGPIELPMIPG